MRSSSAKLLSLAGRHAVGEQLVSAQGASLPCLLSHGRGLLQQLRGASTAKPAGPLPSRACTAPTAGAAPLQQPLQQGRTYSAKPAVAQRAHKADKPWHGQEREWGAKEGQPTAQRRGPQHANGAPRPRFQQQDQQPLAAAVVAAAAATQPRPQPLRPDGLSKPRFLLERAAAAAGQLATAPMGQHHRPQQQQQGQQQQQQQQQKQQQQQQQGGRSQPNGVARLNGRPHAAPNGAGGQQQRHREGSRPLGDRSQQQQQQQQAQPHRRHQERGQPQQQMPWWQKQRLQQQGAGEQGLQQQWQQQGTRRAQQAQQQQLKLPEELVVQEVHIPAEVSVIKLAALLGTSIEALDPVLRELGEAPSSEQDIVSPDACELVALEFGRVALVARDSASMDADAVPRPAVVTVMGHVDHGKTTLLDALRSTSVAASEPGGITQHIGAFEVQMPGSKASLTFLDTPGHAAFSSMRARGAAVTDLVVLVVAADDGVMPQTLEAISHARAAGCPIVVAITKCDIPTADPARVRQQLIGRGLELEEVGGNVQVVEVAATKRMGLDSLEDALLLQAELLELRASKSRRAEGAVIEAKMDKGQGPVATVVIKRGTLKVGQAVVVGSEWGKVRSLRGTGGTPVSEVLPGQPAEISGLKGLPQAGDELLVVAGEERAQRMSRSRTSRSEFHRRAAIARMLAASQAAAAAADGEEGGGPRLLPLIVKADVQGSAEAVRDAVANLSSDQVKVQVVHVGVGPISQSDVQLAVPLDARILGFNVRPAGGDVEALAKQHGLEIRCQRVIYQLLEEVGEMVAGVAPRVEHEVVVGSAEVLQVFQLKGARGKDGSTVAGCRVSGGSIRSGLKYRVLRGGEVVHEGRCASLRRHKLEVDAVGKGTECGVGLEGFDGFKLGDVLQCVDVELRAAEPKGASASPSPGRV